jgi:hypothetical protein
METIHFSSDGVVGVNLSVEEQRNGDLRLVRVYQSASDPRAPDLFTVRAAERHELLAYLHSRCDGRAPAPRVPVPEVPTPASTGDLPGPRDKTLVLANAANEDDMAQALGALADTFYACDRAAGCFAAVEDPEAEDFRLGYRLGVGAALMNLITGKLKTGQLNLVAPPRRVEIGLVVGNSLSVCAVADATDAEILAVCNEREPRTPPWSCVYRRETPNLPSILWPTACPDQPGRMHFLVDCPATGEPS